MEAEKTHEQPLFEILADLRALAEAKRKLDIELSGKLIKAGEAINQLGALDLASLQDALVGQPLVDLGALVDISNSTMARTLGFQSVITQIAQASLVAAAGAANDRPAMARAADALAEGMAESAVSCTCALCPPCKLLSARGPDVAVPEIVRRMRDSLALPREMSPEPKSKIVLASN